jgi:predicted ester cyclase
MSSGKTIVTKNKRVKTETIESVESKNIELVKRFYQYVDTGKLDEARAFFDSKAKIFYESGDPVSFDEMVPLIKMFYSSFPDYKHVIEDIFAAGDKVAVRLSYSGTFKNSFMGFDPNGMSFKYVGVHIFQLKNGKAFVFWGVEDELGMMTQLGLELKPKK